MRSTPAGETGNSQTQQLLDWATHLPAHSFEVATKMRALLPRSPLRDERIKMNWQVFQSIRARTLRTRPA
jgi:hypothetical protein